MERTLKSRHTRSKTKLGLPDLEHTKVAVIVSLRSFAWAFSIELPSLNWAACVVYDRIRVDSAPI